jgi:hypothetical protein
VPEKRIVVTLQLLTDRDADPLQVAERLFDFLASDPDDLFPDITEVEEFDGIYVGDVTPHNGREQER